MNYIIKQSLKFSLPVFILITILLTLAGAFLFGIFLGLLIGGSIALMVGFIYMIESMHNESVKENKEKRLRAKSNYKRLLPNLLILFSGAALTRYTGKLYLFFVASIALCIIVTILQSIKSGEYKKAKEERELTAYYALLFTLPVSLLTQFAMFLLLVYGGNVKDIIKLIK